jgi:glycosyltransferase involved in cell wall biosynthesis
VITREQPDIVHAHNWIVNSVLAVPRRRFGLVLTLHDYSHVCATKRLMLDGHPCPGPSAVRCLRHAVDHYGPAGTAIAVGNALMHPWKDRAIDHLVAVSTAVAEGNRLASRGVPWSVVPNFIPDEMLEHAQTVPAANPALPDGDFLFFVGDLSEEKGIRTLFRAYEQLPPGTPPLLCVGRRTPDTPRELPSGVTVSEKWPHDRIMAALRTCTVAVLPSTWPDPCPTTVLEAMAMRRPVVTTSIGGMLDMVEPEVSGLRVAPADHGQLARALQRLIADPQLRDSLGDAARRKVRSFTASHVAARLESIYRGARGSSVEG